jgi:hypothetical protein
MMSMLLRFGRNQEGGVLVEATVMMTILFVFVLGGIDFLFAFYQWNAAGPSAQADVVATDRPAHLRESVPRALIAADDVVAGTDACSCPSLA